MFQSQLLRLGAGLALALLLNDAGRGDEANIISGRVFDPSRSAVQGATVALTGGQIGAPTTSLTGSDGFFTLRAAGGGPYTLTIEAEGFRTLVLHDISPGARLPALTLELLPVEQQIVVHEKAPALESMVESGSGNVHNSLDAREIRESGARDAAEALSLVDGLSKVRKGAIANDVLIRGFGRDNINVLIDGGRIHGACPNGMDPRAFHVDFAEIERIEVSRGVFDIRNQGSLGGSINIVTKAAEPGLRITPALSAGSFGYFNPSLTASYSGESAWVLGGYSFRASDPYEDARGRRFTEYANYRPDAASADAFRINTGWFRVGGALGRLGRAELSYTRQAGGETLYPYLMMDAVYDNADRLSASWSPQHAGWFHDLRVNAFASRVKHWMTDERRVSSLGAARPFSMATFAGTLTVGGNVQARLAGVLVGSEYHRRKWDSVNTLRKMGRYVDQHIIPDASSDIAGAFAEYSRLVAGRLRITGGARVDRAATDAQAAAANAAVWMAYHGAARRSHADVTPAANLAASYALGSLELFAGGGTTARVPDPMERYLAFERMGSDWVGNPLLRPTRNTEADAGLSWRTRWFSVRPTVFYSRVASYVVVYNQARLSSAMPGSSTMARSFANVDAEIYGGELTYSVGFGRAVLLTGGFSTTRGLKRELPVAGMRDRDLPETPALRGRTTLRVGNRIAFLETTVSAVDRQRHVDRDLLETPTPGYGLLDVKGGVHTSRLNLAIGVGNLLNRPYYEHLSFQRDPFRSGVRVPEPGRNIYVAVQCRL